MKRLFNWQYSWQAFGGDICGGAVAALIALPYGLALANAMGLPPVMGLFTSFLSAPITALLGRNPVLIGGTASATVPFIAAAVKSQGIGGAAKISIVAAIFMMAFSVLRWGRYVALVPLPVVTGFSCGIGAMMIIGQLNTVFGLNITSSAGNPVSQLIQFVENLGQTRSAPLMLGFAAIASTAIFARFYPRSPGPLIGAGVALLLSNLLHLHEKEVGVLSLSIPPLVGFSWAATDIYTVIPSALGLSVVATVNILITSRVVDHFRGRSRIRNADPDAELGAYGIANICAGIFGAPVSVGIPARSLANVRCGGTTRVSNIVHALFLLLFLGLGAQVLARIPLAALAGVTAYIGFCLLDWSAWARLPKMRRLDCAAFLSTAVGILFLNAALSVAIGCAFYAIKPLLAMLPQRLPFLPIEGQNLNRS